MKRFGFGFCGVSLALVLGLLSRCYSPDLSGVQYTCDEANPYCPDGLECIGGACLPPGSIPPPVDGGIGVPDGMVATAGCASGTGFIVGSAFACPGMFNFYTNGGSAKASTLCAAGYKLCPDGTGVDLAACKKLSGFFAAQVNMKKSGTSLTCGTDTKNPFDAGCGRSMPNIVEFTGQTCTQFTQALDCNAEKNWDCYNSSLDSSNSRNAGDGVLCCPM